MMKTRILLAAVATIVVGHAAQAAPMESNSATTAYHRVTVDGVSVFYREAGPKDAPTIVLLHGFPSSSREFDTLIPSICSTPAISLWTRRTTKSRVSFSNSWLSTATDEADIAQQASSCAPPLRF